MILINDVTQIDASNILAFESEVGIKFPEDYKAFIIKSNGGIPKENWLYNFFDKVTERKNTSVIRKFFSLTSDNSVLKNNLREIYNTMTNEKAIPNDMLPIADDPGGNIIGISLNKNDFGYVYFLNHEYDDLDTGYLIKSEIAKSFSDFLNLLYIQ